MRRSLVVLICVVAVAGCGGGDSEPPAPIEIAYQYRLNDDRDSVSTEIPEGHYEVRVDGDCSDQTLKFTEGGVFDDVFDVERLVEVGIDIKDGTSWRIRQDDGDEMPDCEGLTLYPEGVQAPAVAETTTTDAPTTTEAPTTTTATPPTTTVAPTTTTTTNPFDNMTQAQRDSFNAFVNPPPPPPVAAAPSGCDPNYSGCVPIASDVDCLGGSGNGPAYTGYTTVIGSDIYDLDSDGNGVACE